MSDSEKLILGVGKSQDDKNFVNYTYTREQWVQWLKTERGDKKDGVCLVQGRVIGGRRLAKNMDFNSVLMVDIDVGMTLDELEAKLKAKNLGAVIWSTFSHMKAESSVKEQALVTWYRRSIGGELDVGDEAECGKAVLAYLKEVKGYYPSILEDAKYVGSKHTDGGIEYAVTHLPMPKYRVFFFLKTPFSFSKDETGKRVKQSDRIALWTASYEDFCTELGVPFDRSCVDPSRLMFTRRETKNPARVFKIIEGDDLDLSLYGRADRDNPFIGARKGLGITGEDVATLTKGTDFQTPGLLKFVAEYPDFDVLAWAEHVGGGDKRDGMPVGGGSTWACPNEENHSEGPNPEDKGFCLFQDSTGERTWGASCRHATCITMSDNDRVWYLDKMCQKYGADVESMMPFSGKAKLEEAHRDAGRKYVEDEKKAAQDGAFFPLIEKLTPETTDADMDVVLRMLQHVSTTDLMRALTEIKARTGVPTRMLEKKIAEIKARTKKENKEANDAAQKKGSQIRIPQPPPDNDYSKARVIHHDWNWDDKVRTAKGIIKLRNDRNPRIFRDQFGEIGLLIKLPTNVPGQYNISLIPLTYSMWFQELNTAICYQMVDQMGVNKNEPVPKDLVLTFQGMQELDVPRIQRIITTPLIDRDGKVRTERGYQPDLEVFLNPTGSFRDVPTTPTPEDLDEAVYWLFEAVRDFPFSDAFGRGEYEPIYQVDENFNLLMGEDGYPLVNLERGVTSRLNAFALMLTPQLRHLLPESVSVPGFHIDKPAPGSGAGFLVDLVSRIATGKPPSVQTLSRNAEEVRKTITASLMDKADILFLDNINHKVDSGDIAAALTSGIWKDRLLGHSKTVEIKINSTWVFAGNNLSFSSEMVRRLVPIRLDANVPNPAMDRPASMFKHNLAQWATENRANLLWSLQVLIVNWLRKDRPLPGQKGEGQESDGTVLHTMNSFQDWADMIQGIFYAAGLDGVLASNRAYAGNLDADTNAGGDLIEELAKSFGKKAFTLKEVEEVLQDPFGGVKIDLPFIYTHPSEFPYKLRYWMTTRFNGNVFVLGKEEKYGPVGHEIEAGWKVRGQNYRENGKMYFQLFPTR